jgi:phosphatidylglycerophosphate synthase
MDAIITVLPYLIGLALVGVVVTLFSGLFSMVKGGPDRRGSNRLMRWRVASQAVAISLIVLYFLLTRI